MSARCHACGRDHTLYRLGGEVYCLPCWLVQLGLRPTQIIPAAWEQWLPVVESHP